jgi:hypothetical protein
MDKRFTCVSIGCGMMGERNVERIADSADKAADAHASGIHSAYWADAHRTGEDSHGVYCEYVIRQSVRSIHSTVRVYESYKH